MQWPLQKQGTTEMESDKEQQQQETQYFMIRY